MFVTLNNSLIICFKYIYMLTRQLRIQTLANECYFMQEIGRWLKQKTFQPIKGQYSTKFIISIMVDLPLQALFSHEDLILTLLSNNIYCQQEICEEIAPQGSVVKRKSRRKEKKKFPLFTPAPSDAGQRCTFLFISAHMQLHITADSSSLQEKLLEDVNFSQKKQTKINTYAN